MAYDSYRAQPNVVGRLWGGGHRWQIVIPPRTVDFLASSVTISLPPSNGCSEFHITTLIELQIKENKRFTRVFRWIQVLYL